MSGRKQFDVEEALEQATRIFWRHGYADASLELLTTATGLGRGSLYGAFGSKDDLFRQALDRYAAAYGQRYDDAFAAHRGDPVAAVAAFFDVVLARIEDPTVPDGCLVAQSAGQSLNLTDASATHVRVLLDVQFTRLRAALEPSNAEPALLDELATYLVAVNQSLAILSLAGFSHDRLRSTVSLACQTVAAGLADATCGASQPT